MAFDELKSKMASTEVLTHYNIAMPPKLDCDASAYGVGAVLSHLHEMALKGQLPTLSEHQAQLKEIMHKLKKKGWH